MIRYTMKFMQFATCLLLVMLTCLGCEKEVAKEVVETDTYMRVYPEIGGQTCNFMKATSDNGCILFINEDLRASGDGKKLAILKLNEKGDIEWKKLVADFELPSLSLCTPLPDGSFLFTPDGPAGKIVKISADGNLEFVTDFKHDIPGGQVEGKDFYYSGYPLLGADGTYKVGYCNGGATWWGTVYVASFNTDGTYIGRINFPEDNFLKTTPEFKILSTSLYKYGNGQTYFFVGAAFMHNRKDFSWSEKVKLYLNKQVLYDTTLAFSKTVFLDTLTDDNSYGSWFHRYLDDKTLLISTTIQDRFLRNKGQLIKVNDDLEVIWKCDVSASPYGTSLNSGLEITKDGNYFVTGTCKVKGKISDQPFAAKVSKNGTLLWTKIFTTNLNSNMSYGLETVKGNFILTGTTTGFGIGNTGSDLYIIKADKDLNYK